MHDESAPDRIGFCAPVNRPRAAAKQSVTANADGASGPERFNALMEEVRRGSPDAAWRLLEVYGPHIHRVVGRMLGPDMRSKFDSADFVQSVWLSFFVNRVQTEHFATAEQLIAFLAQMAKNKVFSELRRRLYSAKRNVRREQSLAGANFKEPIARGPRASDYAIARERWSQLVSGQPEIHRTILQMKYEGSTNTEIAEKVGLSERTIRRILAKLLRLAFP